jgi:S-DNA-T family DNA segregation ATPase FtsK/SpoIIIE
VQRYGPEELELYLVDFKEGVEFKQYATHSLPHARVVAIESERDFGLSVLESLDQEITRRGNLFRAAGQTVTDLGAYRSATGAALPRVLLVIDEFHVLFERDDKVAHRAAELLDRVVRQGRAFGVHPVLGSQTIAGTAALGRHTLNQIPNRVVLQCSEADSRLLLGEDNPDAQLLTRPGEGILNTKAGLRDANQRFQTAFWSVETRELALSQLHELAERRGWHRRPVIFEGKAAAGVDDVDDGVFTSRPGASAVAAAPLTVPLGLPLTLGDTVVAELRREPGGNLLYVDVDADVADLLTVAVTSLAAGGTDVTLLDFGLGDDSWEKAVELFATVPELRVAHRRQAAALLKEYVATVDRRLSTNDYGQPPCVLAIAGVQRARELDPGDYDPEGASALLERLLRDGPDVGVHVVATADKPVTLGRRLSGPALREFGLRVLGPMSKDDSYALIDSDLAAGSNDFHVVLDDHDRARTTRLRRFGGTSPAWARRVLARTS